MPTPVGGAWVDSQEIARGLAGQRDGHRRPVGRNGDGGPRGHRANELGCRRARFVESHRLHRAGLVGGGLAFERGVQQEPVAHRSGVGCDLQSGRSYDPESGIHDQRRHAEEYRRHQGRHRCDGGPAMTAQQVDQGISRLCCRLWRQPARRCPLRRRRDARLHGCVTITEGPVLHPSVFPSALHHKCRDAACTSAKWSKPVTGRRIACPGARQLEAKMMRDWFPSGFGSEKGGSRKSFLGLRRIFMNPRRPVNI
jgi:hypothetical protein